MFDFLVSSQIKEDSALLKKFTELTVSKYAYLPVDELKSKIKSDFTNEYTKIADDFVQFHYSELANFHFSFNELDNEHFGMGLTVTGSSIYGGFMLQVNNVGKKDNAKWQLMYLNEPMCHATRKAVKLVEFMSRKYHIENFTEFEKRMRY